MYDLARMMAEIRNKIEVLVHTVSDIQDQIASLDKLQEKAGKLLVSRLEQETAKTQEIEV